MTFPRAGGGEYVARMPRLEAEVLAAEVFGALLQDHPTNADAE